MSALRILLGPLEVLYRIIVWCRAWLYRAGFARSRSVDVPVISVGNLTFGGTGKTPLVEYIARELRDLSLRPAIVSRGYLGRYKEKVLVVSDGETVLSSPLECGDEAYLLARRLPRVPVVVSKNRYAGAVHAITALDSDVIILDDGFQHLRLCRDLDILVVDCTDPTGGGALPPLGRLREPLGAMRRAHLIVLNRHDIPHNEILVHRVIRDRHPHAPLMAASLRPVALRLLDETGALGLDFLQGRVAVGFCGIGNPRAFRQDLERLGATLIDFAAFRDHHGFTARELERLSDRGRVRGADVMVTTEKDAVRLPREWQGLLPIVVLDARMELKDKPGFTSRLLQCTERRVS